MPKFRKKPVIIEAEQFVHAATAPRGVYTEENGKAYVVTIHRQKVYVEPGDWIVPEPDGIHFYPIKPDIFASTYEPLSNRTGKQILPMTFDEFSAKNRERCETPDGFNHKLTDWSLSDWMTAVMGEIGEAANVAKKLNRIRDGIPGNKEAEEDLRVKLACELADTFIYLDLIFQRLDLKLGDIVPTVFNAKSAQIGSPIRI